MTQPSASEQEIVNDPILDNVLHPEYQPTVHSDDPLQTSLTGFDLISHSMLNKGMAFSEAERDAFQLHGLLPPHVGTLDEQILRRLQVLRSFATDFERYAFLRDLQDSNETLFYAMLVHNLEELLPLVYTPTVGEGCQRLSEIWRKPRGLFLSYTNKDKIREIFADTRYDRVRVIVVSDGERILGLGDQGAGGMGIPIGKLSLYTACAGIHPLETLPILLDVGTNNPDRLNNPMYIGWSHERIRGAEYDAFVEEFIAAVTERWPNVLLQWEDFAGANAGPLLERYRDRLCTFNDDIQGTAAVAAASLLSAINVTGIPLTEQRIAFLGAGSAGCGIASLLHQAMVDAGLSAAEASKRFYAVDRYGLLVEGMADIRPAQVLFVQNKQDVAHWVRTSSDGISLLDVVTNAKPTVLIGVSGQAGAFSEPVVRMMAQQVERPVIFPLSNPTSKSEAKPQDLMNWTNGKALIGTGTAFPPVLWNGEHYEINQTNNSYIFPGVGLGVLAVNARRITDAMFMAAGKALADLSPTRLDKTARLLPPVEELRAVSVAVAQAVARQAQADGIADQCSDAEVLARIKALVWEPVYRPYQRV
ncbi:NAD-dependent malic enzyme [Aquirhabdus parva]|uniref:Malolactic enzyme n=1 Tax=Aquirhabdus parva TaxID=2283318 RepID=A0A345PAB9_9GAMM|nr:NAD-dependent malic enzyme [Aquirhabdus parva]AXI04228.1 NAD-dependent malic enzyme [Aquirhabdus parva]